ncbi:hypothetical protein N7465_001315 [Penicillium sp. CMV-2018d]|nr:hypothetical protein N7465_001315 [Penicillium sp. CMV-2018d]
MFGEYRTLSAKPTYSYTNTYYDRIYHGRSQYSCDLLINIILAEISLQSTVQQEDALNNKIRAAEKLADIDGNSSQLKKLEKQLEELKKTHSHRVRRLYEWECMAPAILLGISGKSLLKTALAEGVVVAGTVDEKKDVNDRFGTMLRLNNPAFLLRIANAYFPKPLFWKFKTKHK